MHFSFKQFVHLLILLVFAGTPSFVWAQQKSKIKIENSNFLRMDRVNAPDISKFIGDVYITHENVKMYCDSAYQHDKKNMVEAFGRVHVIQGDTIHMYGDYLRYDGNEKLAEVRRNVKLEDPRITLTTEHLDFNMNENVGYYFNWGQIVDSTNVLTSQIGRYYTEDKLFFFKDSVKVETEKHTLYSDTLKYNTETHTAFILGPTRIEGEKETLYSEDGWYNTETNISQLLKNTQLTRDEFSIQGDSIYLDREKGIGKLFDNIELQDTINNIILKGNYLESHKDTEEAFLTDSAIMIQISESDSLFLHADTLRVVTDSAKNKQIKAYNHVKFFRKDLQGKCDSLVYSMQDSTIRLFSSPILWAQGNQITADTILIETVENKIKYLRFNGASYLCSKEDSTKFNQIKGKSMLGYVRNNKMYRMDINGNGETLYYPKDKDEILGVNIAKSSNISIRINDNKIDKIIFIKKPDGNMYPLGELPPKQRFLKDFRWLENYRPKKKEDIFIWDKIPEVSEKKRGSKVKALKTMEIPKIKD
ncbi:MAG: OstA-like protein [Marinifilaceae bacterium]